MTRGDSGTLKLAPLRRKEVSGDKVLIRDRARRAAHDEALLLLGLEEELLSLDQLRKRFDDLGKKIFSLNEDDFPEDELEALFATERLILSSNPTGLYRMFLEENLLLKELHEGVLDKNYLEGLRNSLPRGDWSEEEVLVLSFLKRSLPLLRLSGQSMEALRTQLGEQLGLDINSAEDKEIFSRITSHRGRTAAERREALRDTLLLVQAVAASRGDPHVLAVEKIVRDNFVWAKRRSALRGRSVSHLPLVAEERILGWLGFPDAPLPAPQGVAACYLPGAAGVQATLISAPPEYSLDEQAVRRVMVHEMLHDTQEGFFLTGDEEHDLFYAYTFNEALTEGLAFLRTKEDGVLMHRPAYLEHVLSLYQILQEAGIDTREYEDYLSYLNTIPATEALEVLAERMGLEPREVRDRFLALSERCQDFNFDDKKSGWHRLLQDVFTSHRPAL